MATVYYDLSEQFLASGVKFKYYGIARTVMEVGYELAALNADVRFVIFSPAHNRFFEVTPRLGAFSPTGVIDSGLPHTARPIRVRHSFPSPNRLRDQLRDFLSPALHSGVRVFNRRRWRNVPAGAVKEVDLDGQILVSLGRPKMMSDYLVAMEQAGVKARFHPFLHDMIPVHESAHPSQSSFSNHFVHDNQVVIRHAERLLANSAFTKSEIHHFSTLGYLPPVPEVIVTPLCHELRATDEPIEKVGPAEPYLLCVGTMIGRKNLECTLDAMIHLHEAGHHVPQLVLAGAPRKRSAQYIKESRFDPIRSRIHFIFNPNQAELRALYANALALVIPSRLEGWGLPLGEALWMGTPGLASTAPVLKEVGGNLAQYFDPDDPQALADLINSLQSDPEEYRALKARIAAAKPELRTWKDVAQDILTATGAYERQRDIG